MWRCAKLERLEEVAKALNLGLLKLQGVLEHIGLQLGVVYPNGTTANFHSVEHQVVVLSADLTKLRVASARP